MHVLGLRITERQDYSAKFVFRKGILRARREPVTFQ
jgi:hypothetical protein